MTDFTDATAKIAALLRHPDDLEKTQSVKAELVRKKATVDGQLRMGLNEQMSMIKAGMGAIAESQRTLNSFREEMIKMDRLCAESRNMIHDFPYINMVAQTHRNFVQVQTIKTQIVTLGSKISELHSLLKEDDAQMDEQPNLLAIHYGLSKLREFKSMVLDQTRTSADSSFSDLIEHMKIPSPSPSASPSASPLQQSQSHSGGCTLREHFTRLEELVDWFDEHVAQACADLIPLVQAGKNSLVVRLALVIEQEGKHDAKAQAVQDAQRDFKEIASRFKSLTTTPKELRGYKSKFLQTIELQAKRQIASLDAKFNEDPEKLEKNMRWYFNDLNTVKLGMVTLMPRRWKIFQTYVQIYHKALHDWMVARIDDSGLTPTQMLAVVRWVAKYYAKMEKLGATEEMMRIHLIDNRGSELINEYRQIIIRAVQEWMDRMAQQDRQNFLGRVESALDTDVNGYLRTKTTGDMWRMLAEQLQVASSTGQEDLIEGVIEAMIRSLGVRQKMWQDLTTAELVSYSAPNPDQEGLQGLHDYLIAIANDQIACIDEGEEEGVSASYLTRFAASYESLVSAGFAAQVSAQIESLRDGYVDLGTHCLTIFVRTIFAIDFQVPLSEIFTPAWYPKKAMSQMVSTFEDYLTDYLPVLHPSLREMIIEELSDQLLFRYLSCVNNKAAKFRRSDPFVHKIREDVLTVFSFFDRYDPVFEVIKAKWRVLDLFTRLLESEKPAVPAVYSMFKTDFWDLSISWVEATLRARDDFDRSLLNAVKAKAAELDVPRGPETIMSKVK